MITIIVLLEIFAIIVGGLLLASLYFLPTILAWRRKHEFRAAITVLNVLSAWTLIGWIVAFVWAFTDTGEAPSYASQIAEIDDLLAKGKISAGEHEAMRKRILGL